MSDDAAEQRVALLLGIPVTREEFYARVAAGPWDYSRTLTSGLSLDQAFDEIYAPVCRSAAKLMHRAATMDVSIYRAARLGDLAHASRTHDVLIIVAHWRGSLVEEHDLRDGFQACLSAPPRGSPLAILADELRQQQAGRARTQPGAADLRGAVVKAMNQLIRSKRLTPVFPGALSGELEMHPLIIETFSRDLLDMWFGGLVHPGNQLELADGLHPVAAVNESIASDFRGVVDLSCCTSSVLGTYLNLERGDEIDVIMGDHVIVPAPQLAMIESTLELLEQQPSLKYADARRCIARGLDDWRQRRMTR